MLPTRTPTVGAPAEERAPPRQDTTEHRVRMMLEEGETLLRIVTTKTHILAMTDRSLLSFERHREEDRLETEGLVGIRALEECIRTDMRDFHADGIAGWTAEGSTVYILTESDRSLTILPLDRMGEELQTFNIPFETSGAHMAFRHGVLFITRPTGDLLLMQFSEEGMTYRNIDVPGDAPDPELFDSER
ncbi:TPA: hypothetical protein EYP38_01030, partial [Candidatus Micrarchaeota archaeon]|nr:hypothetical protein [Candidatus Micrarchaeota archaeon]